MNMRTKIILIVLTFLALLGIFLYRLLPVSLFKNTADPAVSTPEMEISYPLAAWSWQSPSSYTEQSASELASQLSNAYVSSVYVDISEVIDFKDSENIEGIAEFEQRLKTYVKALSAKGISVQGLTGGKNWADPSYRYLNKYAVDFVLEYNKKALQNEKLTGIHFDTEPFSTESFEDTKEDSLIQFIEMIDETKKQLQKDNTESHTNLELGYSIPYWLDGQNNNIPKVTWNGKEQYPFYHISDVLNDYGTGYLAIMAYRNYAYGSDGTISLVKQEIEYTKNKSVRIIVGQELNDEEPAKITFHKKTKRELLSELYEINETYKYESNFQGFAIHEVKSLIPYFN